MKKRNCSSILKCLAVDVFMLILFALLIAFTVWLVWMYYFRGPIDIESRGYVSKTLKEVSIKPTDIERYTLQHFHNLDTDVLRGIDYASTCINCHGDYPHQKNPKVRALFNAHSWFIACEVCHQDNNQENIAYRWLDNDTDTELFKLQGKRGVYGARIIPLVIDGYAQRRQDNLIDKQTVADYQKSKEPLDEQRNKQAMKEMHKGLNTKPVSCDQCHTDNGLLKFNELLYSEQMTRHLEAIDVGSMINGYKEFHLPGIFESKD